MPIMHEGCQLLYDHYNPQHVLLERKNEQKEIDHIFNEIVVSVSFVQFLFYHCKLEAAVKF